MATAQISTGPFTPTAVGSVTGTIAVSYFDGASAQSSTRALRGTGTGPYQEPVTGGNHPLLEMPNALCVPHLGWAEWDNFELYFREAYEQIAAFEKGLPLRLANPAVRPRRSP